MFRPLLLPGRHPHLGGEYPSLWRSFSILLVPTILRKKEKVRAWCGSKELEFLESKTIRSSMQPTRFLKLPAVEPWFTAYTKPARGPTYVSKILKASRKKRGTLQWHFAWSLQMGRSLQWACRRYLALCWMFCLLDKSWSQSAQDTAVSLIFTLFITCFSDSYSASFLCIIRCWNWQCLT